MVNSSSERERSVFLVTAARQYSLRVDFDPDMYASASQAPTHNFTVTPSHRLRKSRRRGATLLVRSN